LGVEGNFSQQGQIVIQITYMFTPQAKDICETRVQSEPSRQNAGLVLFARGFFSLLLRGGRDS
jgi:hypothetical protein